MSTPRPIVIAIYGVLALLLIADDSAGANGSKSKRVRYAAEAQMCRFTAELEPLLFRLSTVGDRYGVVRITIRNVGDRPLALSLAADRMELLLPGGPRPAILDLRTHDPAVWDSLPADLRAAVAYPQGVPAGEEESVFVFVPAADTARPPQALRYTIAGLPSGPVLIRDTTPAAAQ